MATALAPSLEDKLERIWEPPPSLYATLASVDHKRIGKRYLVTAFVFLLLGGIEALFMRAQLSRPGNHLLSPETYDQLFTMHGTTMLFWYASPMLSGFSNYLVPLLLGSRDMAFPRLNAFSYWSFLLSGVVLYTGLFMGVGPNGGWFAYPPYTGPAYSPGLNMDFYSVALLFLSISTTAGAINFIVTIFKVRCPGMSLSRMPLLMWSTLTTSIATVFAMPPLSAALIFLELERRYGFHFFDPAKGGHPILWQHLFWVFGHPWVYIVVLPATGMISMMFPAFCRRPIVGHTWIAMATVATGVAGFGVWAHHMFATGMASLSTTFFSAGSMTVSVPSGIQLFAWLGTIWFGRRLVFRTPFLFMAGFIILFVLGGISGVMLAAVPSDWQTHDTYFVVAHLHYVLLGINVFPVIAACYYWIPKMTGRMLGERLGRWNFWVMFTGMNLAFFPMHIIGLLGMPRRIYTYPSIAAWARLNQVETLGAFLFAVGVLLFIINVIYSRRYGAVAGNNPWGASSLEWSTSSPPPAYNFAIIPTVTSREPLWDTHEEFDDPLGARRLEDGKQVFVTSVMPGEPQAIMEMPEDSLFPLGLSAALMLLTYGLIFRLGTLAIPGALLTVAAIIGWLWPSTKS